MVDRFSEQDASCLVSSADTANAAAPQHAMLQKQFKTEEGLQPVREHNIANVSSNSSHRQNFTGVPEVFSVVDRRQWSAASPVESSVFRWGVNPDNEHPRSIGKWSPHPKVQDYEAHIDYLTGMVLNIFVSNSSGSGGLLLALEVPSPCAKEEKWVEVDRARCSSRYPCALRLPGIAVRGTSAEATRFRTVVVLDDEDYGTDFLQYQRVSLDHEAEVTVAHEKFSDAGRSSLKFRLSPALAAGALYVMPVVKDASEGTTVTMRLRQPVPVTKNATLLHVSGKMSALEALETKHSKDESSEMRALETTLQSFRPPWAAEWRLPAKGIGACDFTLFEVVADQLFPGEVELEVWIEGEDGTKKTITDVLVTTRVSWAQAEVELLDTVLKDHFGYFNDPEVIIHGLANGALKQDDLGQLPISNPTEWGYAMQSWVIMAETGMLKPEETVVKLRETFTTLDHLQQDPTQFAHGMFYPYYRLRDSNGNKIYPKHTEYSELPCGDIALLYGSMMMVQGWLTDKVFHKEAATCAKILGRMNFSHCLHVTDCNGPVNGQEAALEREDKQGDQFWSVPLTVNADTLEKNPYNWNVWADEGGLVAMIIAMTGVGNDTQYESVVRQQQRYSPCQNWEGISVGHAAFFNSVFTLPTRSMLGFGTLFSSPYYHEFAVRSVLPTFRAYQKLKKKLGVDYMGPSDAMTQALRSHPEKILGSYAYWPPNNMYDCRQGKTLIENQCTWCRGIQSEGFETPLELIVPHGNMASFLVSAMMEKSHFTSWLEDTKLLMTDASGVYKPGYGMEVVAPARRTPLGETFDGASKGRGIWESLSHGYTILSMYEGLATMRKRYEIVKEEGHVVPGSYEPPKYRPLSEFVDAVPEVRSKIDHLLSMARAQESKEKECTPSDYGPAGQY